jgi:hypothetical protein
MAIAIASALSACALFADIQGVNYDDAPSSKRGDGAVERDEAESRDGSNESPPPEGAPSCELPSFCDAFERAEPKGGWTTTSERAGVLTTDTLHAASGRALHASVPDASLGPMVLLRRDIAAPIKKLRVSFWLAYEGTSTDLTVAMVSNADQFVAFRRVGEGLQLAMRSASDLAVDTVVDTSPGSEGARYFLELTPGNDTVSFGREDSIDQEQLPWVLGPPPYELKLGPSLFQDKEGSFDAWYDDVRIEVTP